jgi:hypothetical protein
MDLLHLFILLSNAFLQLVSQHLLGLSLVGLGAFLVLLVRMIPDRPAGVFLSRNIRVPRRKLEEVRQELAQIVANEASQAQRAIAEHHLKVQTIQMERERVQALVQVKSLTQMVGGKLFSIEKEYQRRLRTLDSAQAREALRRSTEKEINDLLQSVTIPTTDMPTFHFRDDSKKST